MLIRSEKPITKEQYERSQLNHGYIDDDDMTDIFSEAEIRGYGIYSPVGCVRYNAETGTTTYICRYTTSTNCD